VFGRREAFLDSWLEMGELVNSSGGARQQDGLTNSIPRQSQSVSSVADDSLLCQAIKLKLKGKSRLVKIYNQA
jgi:hypothetical protein